MAKTNRQAKIDRIVKILRDNGIHMSVNACGCCESPWVSFKYRGEVIVQDEDMFSFTTEFKKGNDNANVS